MKFRAKITRSLEVAKLTRIVTTIQQLVPKECVLRLTPTSLHFIVTADAAEDGSYLWSEVSKESLFEEYSIESRQENNEILVKLVIDNLVRSLKSAASSESVTVKIIKRDKIPYLAFDILSPSTSGRTLTIVQKVPIMVLKHDLNAHYHEPTPARPHVSIYMPPLKQLRTIVSHSKQLSNHCTVAANHAGEMRLCFETDAVEMETHYRDLKLALWKDGRATEHSRTPQRFFSATVATKKLSAFLFGHQLGADTVICNVVEEMALIFILVHGDVTLTYYIPSLQL